MISVSGRLTTSNWVAHAAPVLALCAAASIVMLEGQSMKSEQLVTGTAAVSGLLFAIGIILMAFQVREVRRSP
jgi:ABC-type Fe3+ transport system permease subunit